MTITCFGELLVRLTPPGARLAVQAETLEISIGGAEANVAAALASLGHAVRFAGVASDNPIGDRAVFALRGAGVDTSFLVRSSGRMGLYFLEAGAGSRPSVVTYDRAGSAFAEADPGDIDFGGALAGTRLLHTGGITPALGPKGVALARAAQAAAREAGVPISFDGNYRGALWSAWDSDPPTILCDLVRDATIFIGNHRDISLMLDRSFSGRSEDLAEEAAHAAFDAFPNLRLIASTARTVLSNDHHRISARVDTRASSHQTGEIDVSGIVERIGTGDAFASGVLHVWLEGGDERAMAETGLALGVLKHSLPGDMTLISRHQLETFQRTSGDIAR